MFFLHQPPWASTTQTAASTLPTHTLTPRRKRNQGESAAVKLIHWAKAVILSLSGCFNRRPLTVVNGSQWISHLHHCVLIGQRGLPCGTDLYRWTLWMDICLSSRGTFCQYWSPAFSINWTEPPREKPPWPMRTRPRLGRRIPATSIDLVSIWPVKRRS